MFHSKYIHENQKHLTLNDCIYIENKLSKGATFKDIATYYCISIYNNKKSFEIQLKKVPNDQKVFI